MLLAPLCVTQSLGRSRRKQRQADGRNTGNESYLKVQLRVPYSLPLEEDGGGEGKKNNINDRLTDVAATHTHTHTHIHAGDQVLKLRS